MSNELRNSSDSLFIIKISVVFNFYKTPLLIEISYFKLVWYNMIGFIVCCDCLQEYVGFITSMNDVVRSKPIRDLPETIVIRGILDLLDTLDQWITDIPPIEQPQRFGNKAFRTWWSNLKEVLVC